MDLRRSSLTADRRRRLLTEESGLAPTRDESSSAKSSASTSPRKKKRNRKERYTPDAAWEAQPRITDLIPRRKLTITAWLTLAALCVAGLEWLYALMPTIAQRTTDGRIAAFDLDGEGSLAAYFSSILLFLSGGAAILVYMLRRHRLDDYRARYRIWLWAAAAWFVMSIDESGSLHEGFKEFMAYTTGARLYGDGSLWWVIAYGLALGVIGLRLLWDMRTYRPSTIALGLSAISFLVAVIVQLQLVMADRGAVAVMVEEGCELAGAIFLLLSMVLHARFMIFDIEGKYKQSKPKPAEQKAEPEEESSPQEDEVVEEQPKRRTGSGLLPWRIGRRRRESSQDVDEEPRSKSRREKPTRKVQRSSEPKKKPERETTNDDEQQLTRRERKAIAKREKREAAELRRMEKEEKRRIDKAERPKSKRFGLLRRKRREDVSVATDEAQGKSQSAATKSTSERSNKTKKSNNSAKSSGNSNSAGGGGEKRQLTKAERKALRRERRRQERERAEQDE